ncbi:DUF1648 domain-containing protein [Streptomyces sp. NPDC059008]|uniref:DUF1648 domain-containing protein n=1 Tax=Streptomyces sp. NPDC059008 TaxID=3346693 RepID=UPI0036D13385
MKRAPRPSLPLKAILRPLIAAFPFVVAAATATAVHASVSTRLPDPLATHFDAAGRADGFSATHGFLTGPLLALLALGVVFTLLGEVPKLATAAPWVIATGYAVAAGIGYALCLTLLGNAGAADASAVRLPLWQVLLTIPVALLAGVLGRLLAGAAPRPPRRPAGDAPRLDLPAGTTAGWSRTISSPPLMALGGLVLCGGLATGVLGSWFSCLILVLSGTVCLAVTSVRVTVDRRGLTLAPALPQAFGIRFRRIGPDRVAEATSRRVDCFGEFGGWGYRVRGRGSGLVLRSGEGIAVRLTSGREFVVTVDDAATAAALLNTYADRARPRQGG